MNGNGEIQKFQEIERGFPVGDPNRIPAIGETGTTQQMFCPLIRTACMKSMCMFWVELLTHTGKDAQRVGHCAYYWNALQNVEIKQTLMRIEQKLTEKEPEVKRKGIFS